jgi:hypothetical protein
MQGTSSKDTDIKLTAVTGPGMGRRRFFSNAALAIAAAKLDLVGFEAALAPDNRRVGETKMNMNTSFASMKQIDAGLLSVGYAEAGPANGPVAIFLHGWPYDIHSFVDVAPMLTSKGYRVIVPYLRGYGTTRFLSGGTFRNGQPAAVAVDVLDLMDALKIEKARIFRQSGPRQHRHPQLSLAAWASGWRTEIRRTREAACPRSRRHRAHDYSRRRRQRRAVAGPQGLCQEIRRPV